MARHRKPEKHSTKILNLLDEKNKTAGMVAMQLGVKPQLVYHSIDGNSRGSRCVRVYVAKVLKKSPSMLWHGRLSHQTLVLDDDAYLNPEQYFDQSQIALFG
jgi:hypothetical protein